MIFAGRPLPRPLLAPLPLLFPVTRGDLFTAGGLGTNVAGVRTCLISPEEQPDCEYEQLQTQYT